MKFYFDIKDDFSLRSTRMGWICPARKPPKRGDRNGDLDCQRRCVGKGAQVLIIVRNEKHPLLELSVTVARKALT